MSPAKKLSTASRITKLLSGLDVFADPVGQIWAAVPSNGGVDYTPIRSRAFRAWAAHAYYRATGQTAGTQAVEDALNIIIAQALEKPPRRVFVRVAHDDGKIFVDLANQNREVVEIDERGWRIIKNSPVAFRRPRGMLPLPAPKEYGDLSEIRLFANLPDDNSLILLMGWIVGAVGDNGYPVLVLNGEQGSGKSTLAVILRRLIDPNEADSRAAPRDEQNLSIAAHNQWVVSFDNLSSISDWLSDGLCRLSTGQGWGVRELYEDTEEIIIKARRPVILNGITNLVTRGDLLSRSIILNLPEITPLQRRTEAELWRSFETSRPYLLGAICDAAAGALARLENTTFDTHPRMADFARWVEAAAPSLRWEWGDFMRVYAEHGETQNMIALDFSIVGSEIMAFAHKKKQWIGSATQLLEQLQLQTTATPSQDKFLRMTPKALADELRRLAPLLRTSGVMVSMSDKPARINGQLIRPIEISLLSIGSSVNVQP
jgi:putative DNA primase/helicase